MFTPAEVAEILIDILLRIHVPDAPHPADYSKVQPAFGLFQSRAATWLKPRLPAASETVGVSLYLPKTAALAFDRVWSPPDIYLVPEDIAVYAATDAEVMAQLLFLAFCIKQHGQTLEALPTLTSADLYLVSSVAEKVALGELDFEIIKSAFASTPDEYGVELANLTARSIANTLSRSSGGVCAIPMYATPADFQAEFKPGDRAIIVATLRSVGVVDEAAITWDQIHEFRRDLSARTKYRRLVRWLDAEMVGKTTAQILDEVAVRLNDYEWALRKHGIATVIGSIEQAFDPKFIAAVSVGATALSLSSGLDALLAAAGTFVAKAAIEIAKRLINIRDIEHGPTAEVAFIHAAKSSIAKAG
jgi:hypothetical protein